MVLAGEHTSTGHAIEERATVATRNEHPLELSACGVRLLDCDPVCGVLARQAQRARQARRPNLLQPDQADAHERMAPMKSGTEGFGKDALHDDRVGSVIHEQPSLNGAFDDWNTHGCRVPKAKEHPPAAAGR